MPGDLYFLVFCPGLFGGDHFAFILPLFHFPISLKMKISNPEQFLGKLDDDTYSRIEARFGDIDRFLGPGDSFKFTCDLYRRRRSPLERVLFAGN